MRFKFVRWIIFFIILSESTYGKLRLFPSGRGLRNINNYPKMAKTLVDSKMYFTAAPFVKEYLISKRNSQIGRIDKIIDEIISHVGVKQFEVLPVSILNRSSSPVIRYILAKKFFRFKKYKKALKIIATRIPVDHPIRPFTEMLKASIFSISKNYFKASNHYHECISLSEKWISRTTLKGKKRQLVINRDSCLVGISRAEFAEKKYQTAGLSYLDLSKKSPIWPEILFEEAWNSFYLKDYNRTLGKLVTYKAPFFKHIFNPEIDVLRALTYYEMCLWDDALGEVESFYRRYQRESLSIKKLLKRNARNYKFYYESAKIRLRGKETSNPLYNRILKSITRDATFSELYQSFLSGKIEVIKLRALKNGERKRILSSALKSSLNLQRRLLGAYVRKNISLFLEELDKAFQGMSYIKLQVIALKKRQIYENITLVDRSRGDVEYLQRNDKQYFWNFVGEFWADELGDYVFSLKSECKK